MGLFTNDSFGEMEFEMLATKCKGGAVDFKIYRAKVPGGWLMALDSVDKAGLSFIPDPDHEWDGSSV